MRFRCLTGFFFIGLSLCPLLAQEKGRLEGVIKDASTGALLNGVAITALETFSEAVSNRSGMFKLTLLPGQHTLFITRSGYIPETKVVEVIAGETIHLNANLLPDLLLSESLVIVGTRRLDRSVLESNVPIDVIPIEDLRQSGLVETNQMMEMLVPSFNFPRPTITDGTDHVRPATLRGLAPDQTLVLINGKRRHPSALLNVNGTVGRGSNPVDLNAIPAAAIDHIEVLRDGAAAQYGSDAIAGVINVILKSGQRAGFSATAGQTAEQDGDVYQVDAEYGIEFGAAGSFNITAEVRHRDPTNRSGPDPRQQYFALPDGSPDPREATIERINHRYGDSEVDDISLFFNGSGTLIDDCSWYLFGNVGKREGESGGFYRRALDNRTVRAIYPDGFLPLIVSDVDDRSLCVGLEGFWSTWSWDLSATHGYNQFAFDVENSVNASLGTASPTAFFAGDLAVQQLSFNLDLVRMVDLGGASPISLALGAEFRREGFEIGAGQEASYLDGGVPILDGPNAGGMAAGGAQVFPGFRPSDQVDESRRNVSVYVDLEGDVTEKLTLGGAARFEDYSDFGSTVSLKASLRYALNPKFSIRAAANNGFRAPSLAQSYYSTSATTFIDNIPFEIRTFPVTDPVAQALGAEPLDAEESLNLSAGIVAKPSGGFYLTLDYYKIEIDDRIVLSENIRGAAVRALLEASGFPGQDGGRYFTNAVDTETSGLDLVARTAYDGGETGRWRFTLGLNVTDTQVTRVADNPPELEGLDTQRFGRTDLGRIEEGQPKDKLNLMVNYDLDAFQIMMRTSRFGEYTERHSTDPTRDQTYTAKWVTDLDLGYNFATGIDLSVGANNLFDVYPDKQIAANSFGGIFVYDTANPFGFNGVYYYTRLAARF